MKLNKKKISLIIVMFVIAVGFVLPEKVIIPVKGATTTDWHKKTFWYEPWGKSGVHKGIDIFADKGTSLNSSSNGVVLYTGEFELGGKVVLILGPKWRLHYYAHLDTVSTQAFSLVSTENMIGTVGNSGNAKGKPPHLHYSIVTVFPYFWRVDLSTQGWKKMFFLDPSEKLKK